MAKTESLKIRFEDAQIEKLKRHAKVRKISLGAIVRELIDAMPDEPAEQPVAKVVYEVKS